MPHLRRRLPQHTPGPATRNPGASHPRGPATPAHSIPDDPQPRRAASPATCNLGAPHPRRPLAPARPIPGDPNPSASDPHLPPSRLRSGETSTALDSTTHLRSHRMSI
ncbi:hypothetical protein VPH35_072798 [Triticum aestivum]